MTLLTFQFYKQKWGRKIIAQKFDVQLYLTKQDKTTIFICVVQFFCTAH